LGIFDLVKDQQNAGKVLLNDVTQEEETREIAFDAVRYRQIIRIAPEPGGGGDDEPVDPDVPVADGFDAPVGTAEERALELPEAESSGAFTLWFGQWADKVGFAKGTVPGYLRNFGAYHTGVDLNWRSMNQDLGKPVYSPASGTVIYQANIRPWGNLTVIRHDPLYTPTGPTYYSRYGHMQNVTVKVGDRVERGQQIGEVGTGGGRFVAHLHYDIAQTSVLETKPNDWPGKNLTSLERNYVDPLVFTRNHRPKNR
jgi:murein DD-endopeptidase MepM/ murein hydrolase activator NlpD